MVVEEFEPRLGRLEDLAAVAARRSWLPIDSWPERGSRSAGNWIRIMVSLSGSVRIVGDGVDASTAIKARSTP